MCGNGRLVVTAITAALGGNVSGNTANLVQNAAIGFLQGKGAHAIKEYVDKYHGGDDSIRAALQGVLGCAGSAATGGDCSSAAVGAAGSVLINKIMGGARIP